MNFAEPLIEEIMTKGTQAHYPADVIADAEKLHAVWAARFTTKRPWHSIGPFIRIAWCEVVLAARKLGAPK